MTKKIILPLAIMTITIGTLFATAAAHAQTNSSADGLSEFIAQKFGLDKTQVQSALTEYKQNHMQQRHEKRLNTLVQEGKLTADQKKAVLEKLKTLHANHNPESMKDLTPEERKTKMQAMHNEFRTWAESQNIDPNLILPQFGKGKHGKGFGMHKGPWNGEQPSPVPTH